MLRYLIYSGVYYLTTRTYLLTRNENPVPRVRHSNVIKNILTYLGCHKNMTADLCGLYACNSTYFSLDHIFWIFGYYGRSELFILFDDSDRSGCRVWDTLNRELIQSSYSVMEFMSKSETRKIR